MSPMLPERGVLRAILPSLPTLAAMTFGTGAQAMLPFLALYARDLGLSSVGIGLVVGLQGLSALLVTIPSTLWIDRSSPRTLGAAAAALAAGAFLLLWQGRSVAALAGGVAILGATQSIMIVSTQTLVLWRSPGAGRDQAVGTHYFYSSIALTIGPLLGTAAVRLGGGVQSAFAVGTVTSLLALAFLGLHRVSPSQRRSEPDENPRGLGPLGRDARLGLAASVVGELSFFTWATFFPLGLRAAGHTPEFVGGLFALRGLITAMIRPAMGVLVARYRRRRVLAGALLLDGAGLWLSSAFHSTYLTLTGVVLYGLGVGIIFPLTLVLVAGEAGRERVARLLSLRLFATKSGEAVGPVLIGAIATLSLGSALGTVGVLCAAMAGWAATYDARAEG